VNPTGTSSKIETDVLIVGAGPVGLLMACELLRRGINCRVIEKSDSPSQTSKALAIQSRTLEVFENMGIVEEFLARGLKVVGANVREGETLLFRPDTRYLKAPYPYILSLPQSDTELLLLGLLHELGGEVEWSRELRGFRQEGDRVVAFVGGDRAGIAEEICTRWLVGCDGAHSRVRHTLGVPFEGSAYEEEFLLADVDLDWDRSRNSGHLWLHGDGILLSLPLPGERRWRLISDIAPAEGEEAPQASVELFQELMAERAKDAKTNISNPTWMSNFKISRRMVTAYRRGRVFLMGDAAHIHSPVGGQGMNTGIQDAYNLAWKLVLVINGKAPEELLDTYEEERLPVARGVLNSTSASTNLVVSRNPVLQFIRDRTLPRIMSSGFVQETLLKKVSQLDVNYRKSSLSKSYESPRALLSLKNWLNFRGGPKAGDRTPQGRCLRYPSWEETSLFREFEGTQFTLLLFDGSSQTVEGYAKLTRIARKIEELWSAYVKTYVVVAGNDKPENLNWDGPVLLDVKRDLHRTYGAGAEALYLIRPDGYVGFRSQTAREDRLLGYLDGLLSTMPVSSGLREASGAGTRDGQRYIQDDADKTPMAR
jgi:2-polyprenyl-6-methoxyphenol hydroxylase-like FAD-dependent oxidoreductase